MLKFNKVMELKDKNIPEPNEDQTEAKPVFRISEIPHLTSEQFREVADSDVEEGSEIHGIKVGSGDVPVYVDGALRVVDTSLNNYGTALNAENTEQFLNGVEIIDDQEDEASAEDPAMQRLIQKLGGRALVGGEVKSIETTEAKAPLISSEQLQHMTNTLDDMAKRARSTRENGLSAYEANSPLVAGIDHLKGSVEHDILSPEAAAFMAGAFMGATTEINAAQAALSAMEHTNLFSKEDIEAVRHHLYDLESVMRIGEHAREDVVPGLVSRSRAELDKPEGKRLGLALLGLSTGVALNSSNDYAVGSQISNARRVLEQLR